MTVIDPAFDKGSGAAEAARADRRDLAMLRHDIRAALQGVVGGLALVDPTTVDAKTGEFLERINASAQMLQSLVGEMLCDGGGLADERGPDRCDVAELLRYAVRRHGGVAGERSLRLEVEAMDRTPETLRADPLALTRIVDNLVGNAIKFADAGTVRLTVGRGAGGAIEITVSDDGPGLGAGKPDGESPTSRRAGEGLGLQIVRSLAGRLGGELDLANRPWGGLRATVRLPRDLAAVGGRETADAVVPDLGGFRVLLAEDNPTNQMVASQMLRSLNARVTVCSDGVEALERFEAEPVDLVVVDIEMPRLSGLDVIRAIRARGDDRAQVPIVALTAYAMREHRERIAAAGANGLIPKPITSVEALGRGLAAHLAPRPPAGAKAPAPEADAGGPVIERATFDALCAAIGADTMDELLEKVIADLAAARDELAAARDPLDLAPIRSASHILISVGGAIGAVRLERCARALNAAAHAAAGARVAEGLDRCVAEIDAALAFARERRAGH